jgi:hypothetical protein
MKDASLARKLLEKPHSYIPPFLERVKTDDLDALQYRSIGLWMVKFPN